MGKPKSTGLPDLKHPYTNTLNLLISRGYLPPATSTDPASDYPAWNADAIAKLLGLGSAAALVAAVQEGKPRFEQDLGRCSPDMDATAA